MFARSISASSTAARAPCTAASRPSRETFTAWTSWRPISPEASACCTAACAWLSAARNLIVLPPRDRALGDELRHPAHVRLRALELRLRSDQLRFRAPTAASLDLRVCVMLLRFASAAAEVRADLREALGIDAVVDAHERLTGLDVLEVGDQHLGTRSH